VIPRTALEPLRIDGHEIPAGSLVMLCTASANRDPAVWKDPDRFDAARFAEPGGPNVLAFGAGPHYCLGAALARVTLEECLRAVLAIHGGVHLTESPAEIPWRVVLGRSPERLLVTIADR
jgi:cytochrome P450